MTDDGKNVLAAVQQVRKLLSEVSKMLLEADAMMDHGGWGQRFGSTTIAGSSYSINTPRGWMPSKVFRFYQRPDAEAVIPCISVLLESDYPKVKFDEPLVSGILMEYEKGDTLPSPGLLYGVSTWHLRVEDRRDNGTIHSIEPRAVWPQESTAKKMISFARPLVSMRSRENLEQLVVSPLLRILAETTE